MTHSASYRRFHLLVLILLSTQLAGCALNSLPRIDPTGQRLLIFPGEPAPVATPLLGAAPTLNPALAANVPAAPPNVVAPPVFTDPFLPGANGPTVGRDLLGRQTIVGPPVGAVAGSPVGGPVAVPTQPGERLSITPSRLLAPVGSEVILLGGVCAENGYLRTNERIEWMLDRKGTGQIVTVGNRGELDIFRWPLNTPRKIDNYFAISATSPFPQCLDRGTPDPNDDVQIRRGDAYVTVSSAVEGTSYVTAYAPNVPNWAGRTASATIYWIDAQWAFPPPVTLAPGQSHTLTTTVTRQSDGASIQGWIVRYQVVGGGAGLGYEQGQTSEATTNAQGRASVEITPTDSRPGTTNLAIEIVRPEQAGVAASPRVTLGNGTTSITWAEGGISGSPLPPATLPPTTGSPMSPLTDPVDSPNDAPGGGFTPSPTPEPTPAGRPDLTVRIEQQTSGPFRVGDEVEYLVTVVNQGDGVARNVKIVDEFDAGMSNEAAAPGENFIKTDTPFDLAPGESQALPLRFRLNQAGNLSHNVTATADNVVETYERAFLTVEGDPPPLAAPTLDISLNGPLRTTVGTQAEFEVTVTNVGPTPATNVVIASDQDAELRPAQSSANEILDVENFQRSGQMRWLVGTLQPNESRTIAYSCDGVAVARSTCSTVQVVADGMTDPKSAQKCVEVRSLLGGNGGSTSPPPATNRSGFDIQITAPPTPSVQERFLIFVQARNDTGSVQENVIVRVLVPPQLRADDQQINASVPYRQEPWGEVGNVILLGPIARMQQGDTQRITIPVDAISPGNASIIVDAAPEGATDPPAAEKVLTVLDR